MKNSEQPAFANPGSEQGPGSSGLTKREYFAAMAMQGLMSNPTTSGFVMKARNGGKFPGKNSDEIIAELSVEVADFLLATLEK